MAKIYASLIIKGVKTLDDVPEMTERSCQGYFRG